MQEKKIILMIHGMWCGKWVWTRIEKYFKDNDYKCISINLKYHDKYLRDPHPNLCKMGILDYVNQVIGVTESIHRKYGQFPIIFGHSMGGLIALIVGSRGFAESLVLFAPATPRWMMPFEPSVVRFFSDMMTDEWGFWQKPIKPTFEKAKTFLFPNCAEKEQLENYRKLCYESGKAAFESGMWFLDWKQKATAVRWENLNCPVCVLVGGNDLVVPPTVVEQIGKKLKKILGDRTQLNIFPNHSHWLIAEKGWQDLSWGVNAWLLTLNSNTNP